MAERRKRSPTFLVPVGFGLMALCGGVGLCVGMPCVPTGLRYGVWPDECPDSEMRLTAGVDGWNLVRGQKDGTVDLVPTAHWLVGDDRNAWQDSRALFRGYDWALAMKDAEGKEVAGLEILEDARRSGGGRRLRVKLPDVPDGDYTLSAAIDAPFGEATTDAPLPLYAPAVVHTMTDRPLYKPGQTVLFRSATLRRTDEEPLQGRPGRWVVRSPSGEEMLVEKDRAGAWGIADGSFPIDEDAEHGTWSVAWETGADADRVTFDVRPFRLPRFTVAASGARAWFAVGQPLVLEGRATYSSGAPVANAPVEVTLRVAEGRWPIPVEWEEPRPVKTGPDGRYRVEYGLVPADLMDRATLSALVAVTEQAGERATGGAQLVLSHESLKVEAVTELGDGLVEGFNNRAYVRASTPDGRPLANATLVLKRPYDPTDPGKTTTTDVDGVAALQIDPGPPVTVVHPAAPVRIRPFVATPPSLADGRELSDGRGLDLPERRALDDFLPRVEACAVYSSGQRVELAARVDPAGGVRVVVPSARDPLSECVADAARALRLPGGDDRTYQLAWDVPDPQVPSVYWSQQGATPIALVNAVQEASTRARRCFPRAQGVSGSGLAAIHWSVSRGSSRPDLVIERGSDHGLSAAAEGCVLNQLRGVTLPEPATADALGVLTGTLQVPSGPGAGSSQPTVSTAYELAVVATADDEELGSGRLVLPVGSVPHLRLRATPSLTTPGQEVKVELVRGPSWSGELPEKLWLYEGTVLVGEALVKDKAATFTVPADVDGFLHTEFAGSRAVVFVAPAERLSVALSTDRAAYEPGAVAKLTVTTRHGAQPVPAGVSLVGVDSLLAQLAPLVGPDDFGRVTVRATSDRPPFGAFDARALALGQIRGENAARAAVMRIGQLPMDPAGDQPTSLNAHPQVQTDEVLVRNFYRALAAMSEDLRAWEEAAPEGEQLSNERVVAMWDASVDELREGGDPAVDAWGRDLSLVVLPEAMVSQVDPRKLLSDGTRLPEDVEDFVQYVLREVRP